MRGTRAWAVGDSGLWVPAPTHSRVPPPATPHPPAKGKSRDRNGICMWSPGPPWPWSPGHLDGSRRLVNTGGINGEHGGFNRLCCTRFYILKGDPTLPTRPRHTHRTRPSTPVNPGLHSKPRDAEG